MTAQIKKYFCLFCVFLSFSAYSQTCLHGSSKGRTKWLLKTGDPLIQVHLHYIWVQGVQIWRLLKAGDSLIEVTTIVGLTVFLSFTETIPVEKTAG